VRGRRGRAVVPPPPPARARRGVVLAQDEARALNHNYIGTEHLLLGLIHEGEGVAAQVLTKLGADLSTVRQTVMQMLSGYEGKETVNAGGPSKEGTPSGSAILDQFGRNLTAAARASVGDPAVVVLPPAVTVTVSPTSAALITR